MSVTAADIRAAIDVLKEASEESEDVEFEHGVNLIDALNDLLSQTKETKAMIEMSIRRQVEDAPRTIGGRTFMSINDNRQVFDHDQIEANVVAWAQWIADGDAAEAARRAAWAMRQLYVSPSDRARIGALDKLEIDRDSVVDLERKGKRLYVKDAQQ